MPAQLGLANDWIGNIVLDADPNLLYGTWMVVQDCFTGICSFTGTEPYRSTDGGITWQAIVFRSSDSGASWQRVRTDPDIREVAVDRVDPSIAYVRAGDDAQLLVTEDSGATGRSAASLDVPGRGSGHAMHILPDPVVAGRLFYVGDEGHVCESTDRARTWRRVAGTTGLLYAPTIAISVSGDSRFLLTSDYGSSVLRTEIRPGSYFLGSDLWWNPAEAGWGLAVSQQYSKVFAAWYVYDAAGHPQWVVMPDSTFTYGYTNGYAATFRGDIYTTSGPPSMGPFDPARVTTIRVGTASIAFASRAQGSISYTAFGVAASRPLSRQPF